MDTRLEEYRDDIKTNLRQTKECNVVLNNLLSIKKQIIQYGITEEGLSVYNEDDALSEVLNIELTAGMDIGVVTEGLSDQIQKMKDKVKEKWENFKKKFEKKKVEAATLMGRVLDSIEEIEEILKKNKFVFDEDKVVQGIPYNTTKTLLDFVLKFGIDLGNKGSLRKTKSGIMWLDLTKFKDRAKVIGNEFKSLPQKNGFIVYTTINPDKKTIYGNDHIVDGTMQKFGWSESNLKTIIDIFKDLIKEFKVDAAGVDLQYTAYCGNKDLMNATNDSEEDQAKFDSLFEESLLADSGIDLLEELIWELEDIVLAQSKAFTSMIKAVTK